MNKEKLKEKVKKNGKIVHLSAQGYAALSDDDKKTLRTALEEEGVDPDEYEEHMKRLWPKVFVPKPLTWRTR